LHAEELDYWERAGQAAVLRPAYEEAIASFEAAVALCQHLDAGTVAQGHEAQLQLQRGQALIAGRGYQAPQTTHAFERALELAEGLADPGLLLPALYGVATGGYVGARPFGELVERLVAIADDASDAGPFIGGRRLRALVDFHSGNFAGSLSNLDESIAAYDPAVHEDLALRYGQAR
jgi:hypothetical protein